MAAGHDKACKHDQCARAFPVVERPGNDDHMGIWTYCGSIDRSKSSITVERL
jgi:hypothetical protein